MVVPRFVEAALAGRDLVVHGDGAQSRCFCDVRDVADVLPRLLEDERCRGRVFNVGSDRPISVLALAELVVGVLGSSSRARFVPYSEAFGAGFEDLRQRRPDLSRVRAAVGFEPKIGLEKTVRDVAAAIRSGDREGARS